ncbi:MAG: trypsin-like peptidase domain-containing protein [Planctomycetes bacterium]|nr:trypsin-like peptidase domain-containing protein [Planctomycetota bacterium]
MRTQLLHLSGPLRGQTITYDGEVVRIGTAPEVQARYAEGTPGVSPHHAEIVFRPEECAFHLRRLQGRVFVNQREVEEVILEHEDLLELGVDGPKARFRIHVEQGEACKPVRLMFEDAAQVGRASGLLAWGQALVRDLLTHATLQLKIGFPVFVAVMAFLAAWLGGWLGGRTPGGELAARLHEQAQRYEAQLRDMREQSKTFAEQQQKLRAEFEARALVVDRMVQDNENLRLALQVHSQSVCLLEGAFGFEREASGQRERVRSPEGDPIEFEYVGSGFLVSAKGHVVTNRHVVQPWFNNSDVKPILDAGFTPLLLRLRAWFPHRAATEVQLNTIRLREDEIDVAVLGLDLERADLKDLPVLPIATGDPAGYRGGRVLVLGYPTGVSALLARVEPAEVQSITAAAHTLPELVAELARRGAIAPLATQGALSEVLPARLIFDAETTQGGSGGPVLGSDGKVIGVTFAVLRGFGGSNLAVPIRYAMELVER